MLVAGDVLFAGDVLCFSTRATKHRRFIKLAGAIVVNLLFLRRRRRAREKKLIKYQP
jgi:hypothetical protein